MLIGIDYGNKLSGTTVIAVSENQHTVRLFRSIKGNDADEFILDFIRDFRPEEIFIDAPLSLPGIYQGLAECNDYFFREADRVLKAMSPMFLGGLTARAIRLRDMALKMSTRCYETYPRYLAALLDLDKSGYKRELDSADSTATEICSLMGAEPPAVDSWHDIDAMLALLSHYRYRTGDSRTYGIQEEGLVYI